MPGQVFYWGNIFDIMAKMKINTKATKLDLTPALAEYIETKIGSLSGPLKKWEPEGVVEAWVEVARTTKHHKKGDVFAAECSIRLPGGILRARHEDWNVRRAIDEVRKELRLEINKFKEKSSPRGRQVKEDLRRLRGK